MSLQRRAGRALLLAGLLLVHLWVGERWAALMQAPATARAALPRLQVAFVVELKPAPPVVVAPAPAPPAAPPRRLRRIVPGPVPASAPIVEPLVEPEALVIAQPEPTPEPPALQDAPELPLASASAPAPTEAAPFAWPPSTRLRYRLGGYMRGEVHGQAEVQWLHRDGRYQVHLDVSIGPAFAPLMRRSMSSEGETTPAGLRPRRYEERTRIGFSAERQVELRFDDEVAVLASGRRVALPAGLQDSASQFVQLSYLFLTGGASLQPGARIEFPLALPRRVERWSYDVVGEQRLDTPVGALAAWQLQPTRPGDAAVLSVEAWFATELQYLPVRIVIRQGGDDHLDLLLERLPEQAAPDDAAR